LSSARGLGRWYGPLALGAAVLAAAVWFFWSKVRDFDWALFTSTLARTDWAWLGAAGALAGLTFLVRAMRWRVLIRHLKPDLGLWSLFSSTAIGFTAIVLLGRPGEMVRPYVIALKERLSFSSQLAALVVERMFDLLMALLIFGFALSQIDSMGVQAGARLRWVLATGGYAAGGVALLCFGFFIALRQLGESSEQRVMAAAEILPYSVRQILGRVMKAFMQGVQSTKDWGAVAGALGYSVLEWALIVGCSVCLFKASPITSGYGLMDSLIFAGFVSFGNVVQIPGVGGGVQIVTVLVLTELFRVAVEPAIGVAMLFWLSTFVVIVPFGLVVAFRDGIRWGKLRQLKSEDIQ